MSPSSSAKSIIWRERNLFVLQTSRSIIFPLPLLEFTSWMKHFMLAYHRGGDKNLILSRKRALVLYCSVEAGNIWPTTQAFQCGPEVKFSILLLSHEWQGSCASNFHVFFPLQMAILSWKYFSIPLWYLWCHLITQYYSYRKLVC